MEKSMKTENGEVGVEKTFVIFYQCFKMLPNDNIYLFGIPFSVSAQRVNMDKGTETIIKEVWQLCRLEEMI
jgi:hypothetical protein